MKIIGFIVMLVGWIILYEVVHIDPFSWTFVYLFLAVLIITAGSHIKDMK